MWNKIIGQVQVKDKLKMLFKSNKLAHAYLFYGYDGVGKDAVAIELAKLVNCENPVNGEEACDKCNSCLKISAFKSEYFHLICALPAGRSDQSDSNPIEKLSTADFDNYLEQLEHKSRDPYYRIVLPNANNIRINSVRDIINKIYLTSGKKNYKVFVISEAEKMKQEAANALLKILEEPPKNSILILTTSKPNSLPSTVSGRCQKIFFGPLESSDIKEKLNTLSAEQRLPEITTEDIELASKISNGSVSRAMEIIKIGVKELRTLAINYLVALLKDNSKEIVSIVRNITENNNKEKTKFFLYLLNIWFKDLMTTRYYDDIQRSRVLNFDLNERLRNFSTKYHKTDIFSIILELEECEKYISQNVNLSLILLNLSFNLKNLIK